MPRSATWRASIPTWATETPTRPQAKSGRKSSKRWSSSMCNLDSIFPDRHAEALHVIRQINNRTAPRLFIRTIETVRPMNTIAMPVQLRKLAGGREQIKVDLAVHVAKPYKLRNLVDVLEI